MFSLSEKLRFKWFSFGIQSSQSFVLHQHFKKGGGKSQTNIDLSLCQTDAEPITYLVSEICTSKCSASESSLGCLFCR